MKIAIIHEMLVKLGGAEKVVESILRLYPDADLFTLIYDEKKVGKIFAKEKINKQVFKTKSQKVYNLFKKQRLCLNYMGESVESFDFTGYDVVIASSSSFAHGAITKPETKFICYYHSPSRYLWDWTNEYKKDIGWDKLLKGFLLNKIFLKLRKKDIIFSYRPDIVLANSKNTSERIKKYYKRGSQILYAPVETKRFGKTQSITRQTSPQHSSFRGEGDKKIYYIIISELTEFKKIDIAIKGFNNLPESNLVIIGDGNHKNKLEKLVEGKNIEFAGKKFGDDLVSLVQSSNGLIFPGEEDFGIVPIEVMASGKPVFAFNGGGLKESIKKGITGEFFNNSDGSDFVEKFKEFDKKNKLLEYKPENCKIQASQFDEDNFLNELKKIVES